MSTNPREEGQTSQAVPMENVPICGTWVQPIFNGQNRPWCYPVPPPQLVWMGPPPPPLTAPTTIREERNTGEPVPPGTERVHLNCGTWGQPSLNFQGRSWGHPMSPPLHHPVFIRTPPPPPPTSEMQMHLNPQPMPSQPNSTLANPQSPPMNGPSTSSGVGRQRSSERQREGEKPKNRNRGGRWVRQRRQEAANRHRVAHFLWEMALDPRRAAENAHVGKKWGKEGEKKKKY